MNWQKQFDALAPKMGDVAPDFELRDVNGKNSVRLSDLQGKNRWRWFSAATLDRRS